MPNHITTQLIARKEVLDALIREHTDEEIAQSVERHERSTRTWKERNPGKELPEWWGSPLKKGDVLVDFALVVPTPDNMEGDSCAMEPTDSEGRHPNGKMCWYGWNVRNWGTKWNGYDMVGPTEVVGRFWMLQFDTAWSHPLPVIEALSAKFPQDEIWVEYADEDFGHNVGSYKIIDGIAEMQAELSGTYAGLHLASKLKYGRDYFDLKEEWYRDERDWEARYAAYTSPGPHGVVEGSGVCRCGYASDGFTLEQHLKDVENYLERSKN